MSESRLMKVLVAPLVSEKTARLADRNRQYVFKVVGDASKPEIRQAVEMLFNVKVTHVAGLKNKRPQVLIRSLMS